MLPPTGNGSVRTSLGAFAAAVRAGTPWWRGLVDAVGKWGPSREVVDGEKLVFTDAYSEGWKPAPDPFMTAIILLEDDPEGGTTYTAIARHRSPEARKTHEEMGFFDGWGTVVTQLAVLPSSSRTLTVSW